MGSLAVCGSLGGDGRRAAAMAAHLGDLPPVLTDDGVRVHGSPRCRPREDVDGPAAAWTHGPGPPDVDGPWSTVSTAADATGVVAPPGGAAYVHGGLSGTGPLYLEDDGAGRHLASHLDALLVTRTGELVPDLDACAELLAIGAPLGGRTLAAGIGRLGPWQRATADDALPTSPAEDWPWREPTAEPGADPVGQLLAALSAAVARRLATPHANALLSGGWDSRLLLALAVQHLGPAAVTAWTTSSDTGAALEELVAADVAGHLGVEHHIVAAPPATVGADVVAYADAADHQSSFHVWLVPLADALGAGDEPALDGLGGGIFLDLPFDGTSAEPDPARARFLRLARYVRGADAVLAPGLLEPLERRARAGFDAVEATVAGSAHASELTTYLSRTVPGIALGPLGLIGRRRPVATPFLDADVVARALAVPAGLRRDGQLYRRLLARIDPVLAERPTAAELTPRRRIQPRRIASPAAARWCQRQLLGGPVAELLAPGLREADIGRWQQALNRTAPQHLLRSLAVLSLWAHRHAERLPARPFADLATG